MAVPSLPTFAQVTLKGRTDDEDAAAEAHPFDECVSKKLDNVKALLALHICLYNFCRTHKTIRVTPAMEAGIARHIWTLPEFPL